MNIEEQIKYWVDSSEHDLPVAESLFQSGHYSWCLYIAHLILEKMLKAIYVMDNKKTAPKTHDLLLIAKSTNLILNKEQEEFLSRVTDFNIEARYPDSKLKFYKLATKEFAIENFTKIKEFDKWLKSQMK